MTFPTSVMLIMKQGIEMHYKSPVLFSGKDRNTEHLELFLITPLEQHAQPLWSVQAAMWHVRGSCECLSRHMVR